MFKYPKLKFTNISRLFALASVVVLTLSLTVSESISAPKPSGWTDLFSDINYGGPDGGVYDIIEYNNALLVAGEFGSVGGILSGTIYANNIAAFDGSVWHSIGTGLTGTDAVVNAMVVYNGDLIVAGSFDKLDHQRPTTLLNGIAGRVAGNLLGQVSEGNTIQVCTHYMSSMMNSMQVGISPKLEL